MPAGGKRANAGRKPTGKTTTKATIYKSDRELINGYALSLGISVNELIHRVFNNPEFNNYLLHVVCSSVNNEDNVESQF